MAGMSTYLAQLLYDLTIAGATASRSFTSLSSVYVSLHNADPQDGTAIGTEVNYTGYARLELGTTVFDGSVFSNAAELEFDPVNTGDGTILVTHWGIYDAATVGTGQLLYSGAFEAAKAIDEGMHLTIRQGQLEVTFV